MGARKKADVKTEDKTKHKCNHSAVKSTLSTMSTWESSSAHRSKQSAWLSWETTISSHSVQLKNMLTLSNSFSIIRTLCLPSRAFHSSLYMNDWPSQSTCHAYTNSNPHMLVQQSWRYARGIHCKYIHAPSILGGFLFSFVHIPILFSSFYFSVLSVASHILRIC